MSSSQLDTSADVTTDATVAIGVSINGEARTISSRTVAELLDELDLGGRRVAVERNKEIVARDRYSTTALSSGDELEIIHFVGGG